jgi:hypothetical protein
VYDFASPTERDRLGWNEARFATFCNAISKQGWPTRDSFKIDEVMPNRNQLKPGQIGIDDSWSRSGTRIFAVSLYAPSNRSSPQQVVSLEFRRGMDHEWHPDVVATVLKVDIGAGFRGASPQQNLLDALQAIGQDELTTYPEGSQTNQEQLREYLAGTTKVWMWNTPQQLN